MNLAYTGHATTVIIRPLNNRLFLNYPKIISPNLTENNIHIVRSVAQHTLPNIDTIGVNNIGYIPDNHIRRRTNIIHTL